MRSRKAPKNYQTTRNSLGPYTFPSTLNGLLNVWDHTISNRAGKEPPSLLLVPVTKYLVSIKHAIADQVQVQLQHGGSLSSQALRFIVAEILQSGSLTVMD